MVLTVLLSLQAKGVSKTMKDKLSNYYLMVLVDKCPICKAEAEKIGLFGRKYGRLVAFLGCKCSKCRYTKKANINHKELLNQTLFDVSSNL
jgi:transposase-like protein